ncbi:hypothetical protein P4132_21330 [Pseudomonas aeruginosa]|nr:hypothetical protein [Pseudomonas aeruginosa]
MRVRRCVRPGGDKPKEEASAQASGSYERGPNNGRLLRDGDFALEVTIYETNAPPHYRLAYRDGKPVAPADVVATIKLSRLDGEVNQFTFTPENNYLVGSGEVTEPHSFDVAVSAEHAGKKSTWSYESYEGRVSIPASIAKDAGIKTESAGPAVIETLCD